MVATTRLTERVASNTSLRVDRESGVIRGVKILGGNSLNGRRYAREAMQRAVGLYEGKQVNINHPSRANRDLERSVSDRFGWLQNVRMADRGIVGDLHVLKSHPLAATVFEAAERNPALFGLSHVAEGRTRQERGSVIVEEIVSVQSVDIVADPATTAGLFESCGRRHCPRPVTSQEFVRLLREGTEEEMADALGDGPNFSQAPDGGDDSLLGDAESKITAAISRLVKRTDLTAKQRARLVDRLGELLDRVRDSWVDVDDEIRRILGDVSAEQDAPTAAAESRRSRSDRMPQTPREVRQFLESGSFTTAEEQADMRRVLLG
jgi:hypothetical protein